MIDEQDEKNAKALKERRLKILSFGNNIMKEIFNWWFDPSKYVRRPVVDGLPSDCFVVGVNACWDTQCIEAIVCSTEFPPTKEGCLIKRMPGLFTMFEYVEGAAMRSETNGSGDANSKAD